MKTLQEIWDKINGLESTLQDLADDQTCLTGYLLALAEANGLHMDWVMSVIDAGGGDNVGHDPCMVLAPDGYPAVAYHNNTAGELCYAKYNGSYWSVLSFSDPSYSIGVNPSLAFDEDGYAVISCYREGSQDLMLIRDSASSWSVAPLYTAGNAGLYSSIVFTSGGMGLVAFQDDGDLKVGYEDPEAIGGWVFHTVDTYASAGIGCCMRVPPDGGTPEISYLCYNSSPVSTVLRHATLTLKNGEVIGQTIVTVDGAVGAFSYFTSMAYTADDRPAIAYYSNGAQALKYAEYDGASWQITTVDDSGMVGKGCSLAFNADGNPTVSYFNQDESSLRYAAYDGAAWQLSTLDNGGSTALLYLPDGSPAVSYYDDGQLKYTYLRSNRLLP